MFSLGCSVAFRARVVAKRVWHASSGVGVVSARSSTIVRLLDKVTAVVSNHSLHWAKKGAKEPRADPVNRQHSAQRQRSAHNCKQACIALHVGPPKPIDLPEDGQGTHPYRHTHETPRNHKTAHTMHRTQHHNRVTVFTPRRSRHHWRTHQGTSGTCCAKLPTSRCVICRASASVTHSTPLIEPIL